MKIEAKKVKVTISYWFLCFLAVSIIAGTVGTVLVS